MAGAVLNDTALPLTPLPQGGGTRCPRRLRPLSF